MISRIEKLVLCTTALVAMQQNFVLADPVPRAPAISGQVIQTRAGEDIELVEEGGFRGVEVRQDVKAGDVIRTNSLGQIALLFADRTQIRIARNTVLVVRDVREDGGVTIDLESGELFGRAARGGSGVTINTPAAAAAIRGTDWTMSVSGTRTTLSVIEGLVDLTNQRGSVSVAQGEAASATIGSAPSKIIQVGKGIREQMLFNVRVQQAFDPWPSSGQEARRQRSEATRLANIPRERWTAEDYVTGAELSRGPASMRDAANAARKQRLSSKHSARLAVVEGNVAAREKRYKDAAHLYERALRQLSGDEATEVAYLSFFAKSLAEPNRPIAPPSDTGSRISVLGRATIAAILESPAKSQEILLQNEGRFGTDVRYQVAIARASFLSSDFDRMAKAIEKAEQLDPDDAAVLDARASYLSYVKGDVKNALRYQKRAVATEPGNADYWNSLALLEAGRSATKEAEAAYLSALRLDQNAPEALANYAGLLLSSGRNEEAKRLIDRAIDEDPSFEIALFQRGRYRLQTGDAQGGLDDMLKATTANPTYSNGLLSLGATYAAAGDKTSAKQSFDLATLLDKLDPQPAQFQALLAVDQYQLDNAIRYAQESVRLSRARGGDYQSVESSEDFGSTLGGVYRFAAQDARARYWGDRTFDPFQGASYFDQALAGSVRPFVLAPGAVDVGEPNTGDDAAFSSFVKGLLLDPQAIASPRLHASFFRVPFQEVELSTGITGFNSEIGYNGSATYQRLGYDPLPYAFSTSTSVSRLDPTYADQDALNINSVTTFGFQPTPDDRIVGYLNLVHAEGGVSYDNVAPDGFDLTRGDRLDANGINGFLGWSHTFAYRNVLNFGIFGSYIDRSSTDALFDIGLIPGTLYGLDVDTDETSSSVKGGLAHNFEVGDDLVVNWGLETGHVLSRTSGNLTFYDLLGAPLFFQIPGNSVRAEGDTSRAWIGTSYKPTDQLKIEAFAFAEAVETDSSDAEDFAPRVGVAWEALPGQFLRAAFVNETPLSSLNTLAPIGVVNLRAGAVPDGSGAVKSSIFRWDSEWNDRLFTSVEYQLQEIENLAISVPVYTGGYLFEESRLKRLSLNANYWIGDGVTAFANYTHVSATAEGLGTDTSVPTVPEHSARVGLSYVNANRVRFTVGETYISERTSFPGPATGGGFSMLPDAFLTDAAISWETEDRHLAVQLAVSNAFNASADVAPLVPGAPRTISASIRGRF